MGGDVGHQRENLRSRWALGVAVKPAFKLRDGDQPEATDAYDVQLGEDVVGEEVDEGCRSTPADMLAGHG